MSHYAVLGLPETATDAEIRDRYYELARVVHPDAGGDAFHFQVLEQAYAVLGDPDARRRYDQEWSAEAGGRDDDASRGRHQARPVRSASPSADDGIAGWAIRGCFTEIVGWLVAVPILAALALVGWLLGISLGTLFWGTAGIVVAYVVVRDIGASRRR